MTHNLTTENGTPSLNDGHFTANVCCGTFSRCCKTFPVCCEFFSISYQIEIGNPWVHGLQGFENFHGPGPRRSWSRLVLEFYKLLSRSQSRPSLWVRQSRVFRTFSTLMRFVQGTGKLRKMHKVITKRHKLY